MVTTQGYRDIIYIGRHQRPHHFSIQQEIPWQDRPLVRRQHRKVVPERLIPPRGEVLIPLDEEAVRELKGEQVESIMVCFLFSYLNASHENRAREIIIEEYPEAFVTTSASISTQFREFERFTTTATMPLSDPRCADIYHNLSSICAALEWMPNCASYAQTADWPRRVLSPRSRL